MIWQINYILKCSGIFVEQVDLSTTNYTLAQARNPGNMRHFLLSILAFSLPQAAYSFDSGCEKFNLRPFHIDLSKDVPGMLRKIRDTELPDEDEHANDNSNQGIGLDTLKNLRAEWLTGFDWDKEQTALNRSVIT
jgi:hypothetical protein